MTRLAILATCLAALSCSVDSRPVTEILEPFRIVEETTFRVRDHELRTLIAHFRVWEVNGVEERSFSVWLEAAPNTSRKHLESLLGDLVSSSMELATDRDLFTGEIEVCPHDARPDECLHCEISFGPYHWNICADDAA